MSGLIFLSFVILITGLIIYHREAIARLFRGARVSEAVEISHRDGLIEVLTIAHTMEAYFQQTARPTDLLSHPDFQRGVSILRNGDTSFAILISYYLGANPIVACMALEALGQRNDEEDLFDPVARGINTVSYWTREFALRALDARYNTPLVARVLVSIDESWLEPIPLQMVRDFVARRVPRKETPMWDNILNEVPQSKFAFLEKLIERLAVESCSPLLAQLVAHAQQNIDTEFLRSIGEVFDHTTDFGGHIIEHDYLLSSVGELQNSIFQSPSNSILVVGEAGVGKSAILQVLSRELVKRGWVVFRSNAASIVSGQIFIGQLEERVRAVIRHLHRKKVVWMVPSIHELAWAGTHQFSQTSVLDMLLPHVEDGSIIMIGEIQPPAYDRLLQIKPSIRNRFSRYLVRPLDDAETRAVATQWIAASTAGGSSSASMTPETLHEGFQLAHQFLGSKASPGNVMDFLKATWQRVSATNTSVRITIDDLLITLSNFTGLPLSILDDRKELDLANVRQFFEKRVLGQPEAIDCILERIALIKAGLTDPTRPQGVYLFAGPTGTGKTELAKTLAQYLFGSPNRMLRMDMSEFQTQESLGRIFGEQGNEAPVNSLVQQIRNEPFSVVLLDEVEKAYPLVWDIFLQVFDDGRLTDRKGNTSDFRHSIVIMTTNLGAAIPTGEVIGFAGGPLRFSPQQVEKTISTTFRREFINRIDRIVVFRPLTRDIMRDLLHKELHQAFQRRGLRRRDWAIEWDESALELLLTKGFTPDLGARPLLRAIERYVLTPLAQTIVRRQFPEGDQFLFIRSDGNRIYVEFIDPDAPDASDSEVQETGTGDRSMSVEHLMLSPRGTHAETEFLVRALEQVNSQIDTEDWRKRKDFLLNLSASDAVWNSPERLEILGKAEYMDRIDAGLRGARALISRLTASSRSAEQSVSKSLMSLTAQQIYLLRVAEESLQLDVPRDAFLMVQVGKSNTSELLEVNEFAHRLTMMYIAWGEKRKMQTLRLDETPLTPHQPYKIVLAFSGFGAFHILTHESGMHVLEVPKERGSFKRLSVMVTVAPQATRSPEGREMLLAAAHEQFGTMSKDQPRIVRRYRDQPSPLVRDDVRGWRTGRVDAVFSGNFDIMESQERQ